MTGSELKHFDLRRACRSMWHSQIAHIDEAQHELERHFNVYDYQPFKDQQPLDGGGALPRGQHSAPEPR